MSQQNPIQEQLIAKAMKDETFRQELLSNPKAVIVVHQDTPTTLHLVLPVPASSAAGAELSDAELEQATGGTGAAGSPDGPPGRLKGPIVD